MYVCRPVSYLYCTSMYVWSCQAGVELTCKWKRVLHSAVHNTSFLLNQLVVKTPTIHSIAVNFSCAWPLCCLSLKGGVQARVRCICLNVTLVLLYLSLPSPMFIFVAHRRGSHTLRPSPRGSLAVIILWERKCGTSRIYGEAARVLLMPVFGGRRGSHVHH